MQNFSQLFEITKAAAASNTVAELDNQVYITSENAPRTVYVADLPRSITYLDLHEFFEKNVGTCTISIKRPMFKGFYYAYVQFQKLDNARKALDEFKYPELCGVQCRVLPFNKTKVAAAGPVPHQSTDKKSYLTAQLFCKGLPKQWSHEDLCKAFEPFGKVISAKVSFDTDYNSRGYGFVHLDSEQACAKAIAEMHDKVIDDTAKLSVSEYVPKLDRQGTSKTRCSTNLYVKNFPSADFTEQMLRDLFSSYGELQSVCIMRDDQQVSKGFGFVCFKDSEDAQKALDAHKAAESACGGDEENKDTANPLYVCEAKTKEQRKQELERSAFQFKRSMQQMNLIVRNVDPDCTKEEFETFFANFGEIRSSKLVPDAQLGFVCFNSPSEARTCKSNDNLVLRNRKLDVNFCEPKESRQLKQEEIWDRRVFNKQKAQQYTNNNQDVISLITSLSLLMGQFNNQGKNSRMHTSSSDNHRQGGAGGGQRDGYQGGQGARMGQGNRQGYQQKQHFYGQNQQHQQAHQSNQMGAMQQQQMPTQMGNPQFQQQAYGGGGHQKMMGHPQQMAHMMPQPGQAMPMPMPQLPQQMSGAPHQQHQMPPAAQAHAQQQDMSESAKYRNEIMSLFTSKDFMAGADAQKKQMVGTHIFRYVTNLVTPEYSPKITGMIIDLPVADLHYSVSSLETLQVKVRSAVQLLVDTHNLDESAAQRLPVCAQAAVAKAY